MDSINQGQVFGKVQWIIVKINDIESSRLTAWLHKNNCNFHMVISERRGPYIFRSMIYLRKEPVWLSRRLSGELYIPISF